MVIISFVSLIIVYRTNNVAYFDKNYIASRLFWRILKTKYREHEDRLKSPYTDGEMALLGRIQAIFVFKDFLKTQILAHIVDWKYCFSINAHILESNKSEHFLFYPLSSACHFYVKDNCPNITKFTFNFIYWAYIDLGFLTV